MQQSSLWEVKNSSAYSRLKMPRKKKSESTNQVSGFQELTSTTCSNPSVNIESTSRLAYNNADSNATEVQSVTESTELQCLRSDDKKSKIRKRFSFGKKKRSVSIPADLMQANHENARVKEHRIKRINSNVEDVCTAPKHGLASKKSKQLSSSLSQFRTSSMITSPEIDDWRMMGLLDAVQKSNSVYSLHKLSSGSQHLLYKVDEAKIEDQPDGSPLKIMPPLLQSQMEITGKLEHPAPVEVTVIISSAEGGPYADSVDGSVGFGPATEVYSENAADIVDEHLDEAAIRFVSMENEKPDLSDFAPYSKSPILSEDCSVIVHIRELADLVDEMQMELPKEITASDWLVLDFATNELGFVDCAKSNGDATQLIHQSIAAVEH